MIREYVAQQWETLLHHATYYHVQDGFIPKQIINKVTFIYVKSFTQLVNAIKLH